MEYILLIICAFLQGIAKSASDSVISFKWHVSYWSRFDVLGFFGISNNQKNQQSTDAIFNWLYRNLLVWTTDLWHFANMIQMLFQTIGFIIALTVGCSLHDAVIIGLSYWTVRSGTFHVFYHWIFLNKRFIKKL
jgi:hypothetical protein